MQSGLLLLEDLYEDAIQDPSGVAARTRKDGLRIKVEVADVMGISRHIAFWHIDCGLGFEEVTTSEAMRALENEAGK